MRSTGRLYALDVSATRLAKAKPRFARSGLSNIVPVVLEHENDTRVRRLAGKAHRVLVDAPCSGVGTLRRNPDLKWRQSVQSLQELTALQARILASASRCVAPGGRLVYATCSVLIEENQAQAERFLAEHPDFVLLDAAQLLAARTPLQLEGPYLNLRPDVHGTDGFFAAVFERRKAGALTEPEAQTPEVGQTLMSEPAEATEVAEVAEVLAEAGGEVKKPSRAKKPKKVAEAAPAAELAAPAEPALVPAPASAIDAFAAFLAKEEDRADQSGLADSEDSKPSKPAKKPKASQAAGRTKKA